MAVLQDQVQAEVLLRVDQPEVTGGGQVKGQPALLCSPHFPTLQQQELHFTEERTACWIQGISRLYIGFQYKYPCLAEDWNIPNVPWMQHQSISTVSRCFLQICFHKMKTQVWLNAPVMKCPLWFVTHLLFLSFCKLIFIPETNGKQHLSRVYENNLKACGMLRKMFGCHANDTKWVYNRQKN